MPAHLQRKPRRVWARVLVRLAPAAWLAVGAFLTAFALFPIESVIAVFAGVSGPFYLVFGWYTLLDLPGARPIANVVSWLTILLAFFEISTLVLVIGLLADPATTAAILTFAALRILIAVVHIHAMSGTDDRMLSSG